MDTTLPAGQISDQRDEKAKLHQLCDVCQTLCRTSRALNDLEFCRYLAFEKFKTDNGGSGSIDLLHESIPDTNQWNENNSYIFEDEIPHHLSGAALEFSEKDGCHLCSLLWHHLSLERYGTFNEEWSLEKMELAEKSRRASRDITKESREPLFTRVGVQVKTPCNPANLAVVLYSGSHKTLPVLRSMLNVWTTKDVSGTFDQFFWFSFNCANKFTAVTKIPLKDVDKKVHAANFSTSTASEATIELAKDWINSCKALKDGKGHFLCRQAQSWEPPTRLLDVRANEPHLYFTRPEDTNLQYLCLSHCWGGADILKLTQASLGTLQNGVALEELPQTFRDAIDITRRLGYTYLWIDSLCIFQDDREDWKIQAQKMAEIYMHADVTIAALGSEDSHGGCYSIRDQLSYWPCNLPAKKNCTAWYGRVWPFHNERFTNAPLLRRGWVLQERCLGKRSLYFGRFGIYWECATVRADEAFPGGFVEDFLGPTGRYLPMGESMMKALVSRRLYLASDNFGQAYYLHTAENPCPLFIFLKFLAYWYQIIGQYSKSSLTFSQDKLIATAGIVNLVQKRTGLTSFAGLWKEFLLEDLLWTSGSPEEASRPKEYRAPSFSWASIDGAVKRRFDRLFCSEMTDYYDKTMGEAHSESSGGRRYIASIVSQDIIMVDPSHTSGAVLEANIVIQGYLTRFTTKKFRDEKDGERFWTHPYGKKRYWHGKKRPAEDREQDSRWFVIDVSSDALSESLDVVCMPIIEWHGFD